MLSKENANAFNTRLDILDCLYFSVISAATVGYGDIAPVSHFAKIVVMAEVGVGWLFSLLVVASVIAVKITRALEFDKSPLSVPKAALIEDAMKPNNSTQLPLDLPQNLRDNNQT